MKPPLAIGLSAPVENEWLSLDHTIMGRNGVRTNQQHLVLLIPFARHIAGYQSLLEIVPFVRTAESQLSGTET